MRLSVGNGFLRRGTGHDGKGLLTLALAVARGVMRRFAKAAVDHAGSSSGDDNGHSRPAFRMASASSGLMVCIGDDDACLQAAPGELAGSEQAKS